MISHLVTVFFNRDPITFMSTSVYTMLLKEETNPIAVESLNKSTTLSLRITIINVMDIARRPSINLKEFDISHHLFYSDFCKENLNKVKMTVFDLPRHFKDFYK